MTLMKAKKPLALLLALLAALSLLGTTALAAGLPEETIAAQTELCGEDCGHTHEEVFSHTEHTEESLPEPEEIAVPVATPLLEQPEPEAGQPSDTSGVIPGSGIYWELNEYGWLMLSGNGSCPTFVSPDDQPWAAVREQITQVWFEDMDALSIPSLAYWFTGCTALTMAEIPYTTPVIGAAAFADCPSLRQIQLYYDGRISRDNKRWANTIPAYQNGDGMDSDRSVQFVVSSHPGLTDLFLTQARHEQRLRQPLTADEIKTEAARLLGKLQEPVQPNSPGGTHFIAELSPDFAARANSRDTAELQKLLPFRSLALSNLKDRKGVFAVISKEEDRTQPLRSRKPSVRSKLQQTAEQKPTSAKKKDLEL